MRMTTSRSGFAVRNMTHLPTVRERSSVVRSRLNCVLLLGTTVFCGLASRQTGWGLPTFIVSSAGDCLWTVAVYLMICTLFPSWPPRWVLAPAVAISFVVETSHLLDWWLLNDIRQTRVGRLFLGTGFLWADFPRYLAGGLLAFVIDRRWAQRHLREAATD